MKVSERDPRIHPEAGDVLHHNQMETRRKVVGLSGRQVHYIAQTKNAPQGFGKARRVHMNAWRAWARNAQVIDHTIMREAFPSTLAKEQESR